jgi:hypothetical protein
MTKGHNKGNAKLESENAKGQSGHRKAAERDKATDRGRNDVKDQAQGRKGKNNI